MTYAPDDHCPDCESRLSFAAGSDQCGDDPGEPDEVICETCGWSTVQIDHERLRAWLWADHLKHTSLTQEALYLAFRLFQQGRFPA